KSEHCLDGRRDIEIIARNIPVPHAHARAGESESVALLAAQRADIGAAAAALRVIGGGEGKKREGCGEDTARKRSTREIAKPADRVEGCEQARNEEERRARNEQLRRAHAAKCCHDDKRRPAEKGCCEKEPDIKRAARGD